MSLILLFHVSLTYLCIYLNLLGRVLFASGRDGCVIRASDIPVSNSLAFSNSFHLFFRGPVKRLVGLFLTGLWDSTSHLAMDQKD